MLSPSYMPEKDYNNTAFDFDESNHVYFLDCLAYPPESTMLSPSAAYVPSDDLDTEYREETFVSVDEGYSSYRTDTASPNYLLHQDVNNDPLCQPSEVEASEHDDDDMITVEIISHASSSASPYVNSSDEEYDCDDSLAEGRAFLICRFGLQPTFPASLSASPSRVNSNTTNLPIPNHCCETLGTATATAAVSGLGYSGTHNQPQESPYDDWSWFRRASHDASNTDSSMRALSALSVQERSSSDEDKDTACLTPPSSPTVSQSISSSPDRASRINASTLLSHRSLTPEESPSRVSSIGTSLRGVSATASLPDSPRSSSSGASRDWPPVLASSSRLQVPPLRAPTPEVPSDTESSASSIKSYEPWFEDPDSDFNSVSSGYPDDEYHDPNYSPSENNASLARNKKPAKKKRIVITYSRRKWTKPYPRKSMYYIVREIIGRRVSENADTEYQVAWEGYGSDENTWEPSSHLTRCRDKVKEFESRYGQSPISARDETSDDSE